MRDLDAVRRSFAEAAHAAEAAQGSPDEKPYYELPDVQLRGLLYVLGGDPRLQAFVERTLGPLLDHDARNDTELLAALQVYLTHGRNKSAAADAAHLSRQAFYQRLTTIERVLVGRPRLRRGVHQPARRRDGLRSPPHPLNGGRWSPPLRWCVDPRSLRIRRDFSPTHPLSRVDEAPLVTVAACAP